MERALPECASSGMRAIPQATAGLVPWWRPQDRCRSTSKRPRIVVLVHGEGERLPFAFAIRIEGLGLLIFSKLLWCCARFVSLTVVGTGEQVIVRYSQAIHQSVTVLTRFSRRI